VASDTASPHPPRTRAGATAPGANPIATSVTPKYLRPDFMQKQLALYYRARALTWNLQRYGDNDAPIPAVTPIAAIRAIRPVRGVGRRGGPFSG